MIARAALLIGGLLVLAPAASGQTRFEIAAGAHYGLQQRPLTPGWAVAGGFRIDQQDFVVEAAWSRHVTTRELRFSLGAALLRRRLFRLFIGVFARQRSLSVRFARGQRPGQRPPASFGRPARPESRCPDASVVPFAPLDIRAAFWYDALGREMPLRWP